MKLENFFEVPAPRKQVWDLLMDVPRVTPCMPGAKLTETLGEAHWKASMSVKLGPITLVFDTEITREGVDEAAGTITLKARAREKRGRGGAQAAISASLSEVGGGTRAALVTELSLSGAVAQYGRGILEDVSAQLIGRFANCLEAQLVATHAEAAQAIAEQARLVDGLALGVGAVLRAISRFLARLFGFKPKEI